MEWHNMSDAQAFSDIDITMNGNSVIDVNVFNCEWSELMRLELGRIMMDNQTLISRLIIRMTTLTVGST
jgi:hypothetical protein